MQEQKKKEETLNDGHHPDLMWRLNTAEYD